MRPGDFRSLIDARRVGMPDDFMVGELLRPTRVSFPKLDLRPNPNVKDCLDC